MSLSSTSDRNDPLYDLSDEGAPPPRAKQRFRPKFKKRAAMSISSLSSGSQAQEVSGDETETGSGYSTPAPAKRRRLSLEDSQKERNKWLGKLNRLQKDKIFPSRTYTKSDNVQDMKDEYDMLTRDSRIDKSTETMFSALAAIIGGLEIANGKYDPLNLKLSGWQANVDGSRAEVKECFEEIYEKYFEDMEAIPEVRLMMIIFGSAIMTHVHNSLAPRSGGVETKRVMKGPSKPTKGGRKKPAAAEPISDAVGIIE